MSDLSSVLPIKVLLGIEGIRSKSCISSLVLSASDIARTCAYITGEMFAVDDTVCAGDTIVTTMHNERQQSDVIQIRV
jgi:hypothetical protein